MSVKVAVRVLQNSHRSHETRAAPTGRYRAPVIDTHCHLTSMTLDVHDAIAGLAAVVTVGTSVEDARAAVALARGTPRIRTAVGIHPNTASAAASVEVRSAIEELTGLEEVVAIGETGFDTHWDRETLDVQQTAFDWHAQVAATVDKPLVLHVRDAQGSDGASRAAERAIQRAGHSKGVLHCCNGDQRLIDAALELGWYVSFAGNLTYKSAAQLRLAASAVPFERLLVETDSPYLAPLPHRGERNRPAYVVHTARVLADLRGVGEAEMERLLDGNARRLFALGAGDE